MISDIDCVIIENGIKETIFFKERMILMILV